MTTSPSRRQFVKGSLAGAFALGTGGLLAACGDDDASTAASGSPTGVADTDATSTTVELEKLSVLMPFQISLNFIADMAGKSSGFMADNGVDLDLQFARSAPQAFQQLAAGNVHVIRNAPIAVAKAVSGEGAPFTSIGMPVQQLLYVLVSSADQPLDSLEDLIGRKVGLPQLGSNAEDTFNLLMRSAGLDPAEVTLEAVGNEGTSFTLVEEGRVDAIFATREAAALMQDVGMEPHVAEVDEANPLLGICLVSTTEFIESHRDPIVDYLRGLAETMRAIRDGDDRETILSEVADEWDLSDLKQADEVDTTVLDTIASMWFAAGEENLLRNVPEHWERGVEAFQRLEIVPADAQPSDFYTNDLWDEAFG